MGAFTYIETDTGTNVDISAATAVGAYTSTGDKLIMVDVSIDAVAGNGDYVMYVTRQIGGSGSAYRILPQTTMTAASGLTAISAQSGWITVRNGDVLTCYVDGLAGDTSTPDWSTRWFELAGVTAAGIADAVWDEATADHTTASSFGALDANVDAILADTGTDGVKIAGAQTVATVTNLTNLPSIPANWITAAGVATGAIDADAIASNAITSAKIATGAITNAKFASGAIDAAAIATDAIGSAEISAAAVTKIQSGLATAAALDAVDNFIDTEVAAILAAVDTEVAAIKAKTDNLPATPASAGEYTANIGAIKAKTDNLPLSPASSGEYTSALTAIQNDLDNPNQYKADVSSLALQATSLAIKGQTDKIPAAPAQTGEYNAALTAIQADLDNPTQYKADVSGLATQASVNAIPTTPLLAANYTAPDNASIAAILEDTGATIPATLAGLATSAEVGAIALLDEVVVGSYTMQDILKILAAKMVGKATGGGTTTITYRGLDDTSDVIVETVDSNGNRSAVTLTV